VPGGFHRDDGGAGRGGRETALVPCRCRRSTGAGGIANFRHCQPVVRRSQRCQWCQKPFSDPLADRGRFGAKKLPRTAASDPPSPNGISLRPVVGKRIVCEIDVLARRPQIAFLASSHSPKLTRQPRPTHDPPDSPPPGTPRSHTDPRRTPGRTWRRRCSRPPGASPARRVVPARRHASAS